MDLRPSFVFSQDGAEVMSITADGRFYIKGTEVETGAEVRDALAEFALQFNQQRAQQIASLEYAANTALAHLEGRKAIFSTREVSTVTTILRTALGARVNEHRGTAIDAPTWQDPSPN